MAGGKLRLFACRSAIDFSQGVAEQINNKFGERRNLLDKTLSNCSSGCYSIEQQRGLLESIVVECDGKNGFKFYEFADGEYKYKIEGGDKNSVRRDIAYVIQLTDRDSILKTSVHDNFMEAIVLLATLKDSGVEKTSLVLPCLPYSRQDAQSGREPVMTKSIAKMLEPFIDSIITIDVHSKSAFNNAYRIKSEALYSSSIIIPGLLEELNNDLSGLVVLSPDAGAIKKAEHYQKKLKEIGKREDIDIVFAAKNRPEENVVGSMKIIGDVNEKTVFVPDDINDTAGTIINLITAAYEQGAKRVIQGVTHPKLNRDAPKKIKELRKEGYGIVLITTDSVNHSQKFLEENKDWLKVKSIKSMIGDFITSDYLGDPVSGIYKPSEKF